MDSEAQLVADMEKLTRTRTRIDRVAIQSGPSWRSASRLMPHRDHLMATTGPDIIDMLTMHPETRRKVVRALGELDALP
jgi:hypothetical protein